MVDTVIDDYIEINRFRAVNNTKTLEELADVIESFCNDNGEIKGKSNTLNGLKMAEYCRTFTNQSDDRYLTRNWGIRQQAVYLSLISKK